MSWVFFGLVLSLHLCQFVFGSHNFTIESLDTCLQDFAFRTLVRHRPQTGNLYRAMLPANLSGMTVSIVRLRSRRLWNRGVNFSNFHIPSRTLPVPHVKRVALVYQDFGNWSSHYYTVPGYSMVTPVIGFKVFDASNIRDSSVAMLNLNILGRPIMIRFSNTTLSGGMVSKARCASFSSNGTLQLSEMSRPNVCLSQDQGRFSIVVPLTRKQRQWNLWGVGFVLGFCGLILIGYVLVSVKVMKAKKVQVMEKQADEGSVLATFWVGRSKMPSATVTRTQPTLADGGFP